MNPSHLILLLACTIAAAAEHRPPPDAARLAASLVTLGDQNGDGLLTLAELTAGFQALRPDHGAEPDDTAATGKPPTASAPLQGDQPHPPGHVGRRPPPPPKAEELATLFASADADGNGTLDSSELARLLKNLGRHRGGDHQPPPPPAGDGAVPPAGGEDKDPGRTTSPPNRF